MDTPDEFAPQYQFFPRYGGANSSQLAQLLGFGYDPPSSFLAIKVLAYNSVYSSTLPNRAVLEHATVNHYGHGGMFQNSPVRKNLGTVLVFCETRNVTDNTWRI